MARQAITVLEGDDPQIDFQAYTTIKVLDETERLVRVIGQSTDVLFDLKAKTQKGLTIFRLHATTLGQHLLSLVLDQRVHRLPEQHPEHHFAVEVELLCRALNTRGLSDATNSDIQWASLEQTLAMRDAWNLVVADIRTAIESPQYQLARQRHTKTSAKNLKSAMRWLEHSFASYARLLVLRLDLYYPERYNLHSDDPKAVKLEEAFVHRAKYLQGLSHWIHDGALVGYLCKTEFKLKRSIHHHLLVLVDANKIRKDIVLIESLGGRWEKLTKDRGTYFNVNMRRNGDSQTCGIGVVHVDDEQKVFNLKHRVVPYLVKPDYHVRWVVPKKYRLLLKSITKPLTGTKPGRPRNNAQPNPSSDASVAQGV